MGLRTLEEINDALEGVRASIKSAQTAQAYEDALGQSKTAPLLQTLYDRENELLVERAIANGSVNPGLVVVHGVPGRR